MKKILVLTVALVLAFSAVAFAATTITPSGHISLAASNDGDVTTYTNGYRLLLTGSIDENHGFQIRWDDVPTVFSRCNYWVNIPGVGKVIAGKQNVNYSAVDYFDTNLNTTVAAVAFAPALPAGKAVVFWAPDATGVTDNDVIGASASFDVAGATIYGIAKKANGADEATLAFGGKYVVTPDTFNVYAEWNKLGNYSSDGETIVGANYTAGGFNVYGEYQTQAKVFAIDAYKTLNGVEFELSYEKPDTGNATTFLGTTLYF